MTVHTDPLVTADTVRPKTVSDVMLAFPANVTELLPDWDSIPEEFKSSGNEWHRFADHWFASGLAEGTTLFCEDGIDGATACRHLKAILGSYQPKHEHKLAGVAYLCSLWFSGVEQFDGDAT